MHDQQPKVFEGSMARDKLMKYIHHGASMQIFVVGSSQLESTHKMPEHVFKRKINKCSE